MLIGEISSPDTINTQFWVSFGIEISFAVDIFLKFFKEYIPIGKNKPITEFSIISQNYITGNFFWDLIIVAPF